MKNFLKKSALIIAIFLSSFAITQAAINIVPNGGTGVGTITGIIKGNGTSAFSAASAGTDYQAPITLTTTGTSGASTFTSNTLNIPNYGSALSGYIPYTGGTSNVDLGTHNLTVDTTSLFVDSVNHRVGFGTITPNQVVDIFGANNQLRISSGAASLQSIYFYDNTKNSAAIYARNDSSNGLHIENRLSGGALYLGGNTSQKDITILNSGNVGINNITPLFKADIIGTSVTQATAILSNYSEIFGVSSSDVLPELAIGAYSGSPFAVWIQGKRHDNNATAYPIVLQPAGGNLGIGTTAPTKDLSFGNNAAKTFWIENSATDVVGRALTIAAGSTIAGTSTNNVAGGQLILQGGLGTGTADSSIAFQTGTTLTTGKVLQTMSTKMIILGTGQVGIGVTALRNTTDIFQAQGNVLIGDTTGGSTMTLQADYTGAGFPNGTSLTISAGVTHVSTGNGGGLTFNAGNGGGVTGVGGGIVFNSGSGGTAAGAISFKPGGVGNAAVYTFNGITTFGYAQSVGGGAIQLAAGAVSNSLGSNVYITASPGGTALGPNLGGSVIIAAGTGNGSAALGAGAAGNIQISGNTGIWTSSPTANFQVNQSTTGPGTVTVTGTAVTGTGTQFLNTFKVGDTITVTTTSGAETKAISAIASNTSMTTAAFAGTAATNIGYTLVGGNRFAVLGNGNVGIGTLTPSSLLTIGAGTANYAPLQLTSGTVQTTSSTGSFGYDGTDLFFTPTSTIQKTIPTVVTGRQTAQSAADASVVTQTVGTNDASYLVSANVLVTTATLHSFTVTCTYTDEGNTSRTVTLPFQLLAGTSVTSITNAQGTVPYEGSPIHIRAKGGTTITLATVGTFTTVTYNVEGAITLLQ